MANVCLKLYVIPGMEVTIKEGDPNWIGAWWLGFPVIGTCIVIFAGKVQKKRAKSFTSLMADLRQDINRVSSFRYQMP